MKKHFLISHAGILFALVLLLLTSCRKSDYFIELEESISDQGGGTGTVTWTNDRDYLLNGLVFVNDGQVLTIEAGTVIRAKTGQGSLASALIVARGGTIIAEGERDNPIIFTVEGDDLEGSVPLEAKGLWGGLIILGNATINVESREDLIEGILVSEPRGVYGGPDDDDNSGILRYVSIRHGGTNIGEGNEINGLTLGGVGRQTIIENVEVISNADDGVEFFGGDVNCKNLCVSFCGDDAFDLDQGYHGKGQFWLGIRGNETDNLMEVDGGLQALPLLDEKFPWIYNITLIGEYNPVDARAAGLIKSYGAVHVLNSIFLHPGKGVSVLYSEIPGDSYSLFTNGYLSLQNNVFYPGNENGGLYTYDDYGTDLADQNLVMNSQMSSWQNGSRDPGISSGEEGYHLLPPGTEFDQMAPYSHIWFEQVSFKGAFGSNNWIEGWTLLEESGLILD